MSGTFIDPTEVEAMLRESRASLPHVQTPERKAIDDALFEVGVSFIKKVCEAGNDGLGSTVITEGIINVLGSVLSVSTSFIAKPDAASRMLALTHIMREAWYVSSSAITGSEVAGVVHGVEHNVQARRKS